MTSSMNRMICISMLLLMLGGGCFHVKDAYQREIDSKIDRLERRVDQLEKNVDELQHVKVVPAR